MKKTIVLGILAFGLTADSVFGQAYFEFSVGLRHVYDDFTTPGVATTNNTVNTAFLWGPASTTPLVDSYLASVPTNTTSLLLNFSVQQAWSAVLGDSNFQLAVNNNSSSFAIQLCNANGSIVYNNGFAVPVTGTTPGTTYTVYLIGWDANYATPALAAAANGGAGAALGWSNPFQYTPTTQLGTPLAFNNSVDPFGTIAVPEPGTIALSVMGGLSVFMFRRRK